MHSANPVPEENGKLHINYLEIWTTKHTRYVVSERTSYGKELSFAKPVAKWNTKLKNAHNFGTCLYFDFCGLHS